MSTEFGKMTYDYRVPSNSAPPRQKIARGPRWLVFAAPLLLGALLCPTASLSDGLTYLAHAPPDAKHPPLIILLHGSGAEERDMISLWRDLPQNFVVVSPRAPFVHGGGYVWYRKTGASPRESDLTTSRKVIDLVVAEAAKRFDADPNRIFIGGFSQGGVVTYEVALREPGRFRGAAVLSGLLLPTGVAGTGTSDRSPTAFFIGHGTADTRIPFAAAASARAALMKRGVPVDFHAYAGMGHATGMQEIRDLCAWLAKRSDAVR